MEATLLLARNQELQLSADQEPTAIQERLGWQYAVRDDRAVAHALHEGKEIDGIHELSEAGLLDEFFVYLKEIGIMKIIEGLRLEKVQRVLVPATQFILLYMLKILFGVESMNALPNHLFSNIGLMQLIGFNAVQIENGLTKRGDDKRQSKKKRGPISPQCLSNNICKLTTEQMEQFFNQVIQHLVATGLIRGDRMVALDGSKLPTTEKYKDGGKLKETRKVKVKGQKESAIQEYYIYGWKILVLIDVQTRLPLAVKVVKIQEYEGCWLVPLVEKAEENLGCYARITKVVVDRGYLDGEDLWQLEQKQIIFVIVAKAGMVIAEDAQALAKLEKPKIREKSISHGHGKKSSKEVLRTKLVGIAGLTTYDNYGDIEHTKQKNRRDFEGKPLNAVVVQLWNNHPPSKDGIVYLTNGPVDDPFVVFDDYDWRSVIENGIFKEGKHPWHLLAFPKKTEGAVIVHCFFTLTMMAICTAFRLCNVVSSNSHTACDAPSPQSDLAGEAIAGSNYQNGDSVSIDLLQGEGTASWRQRLRAENRDKVIVFIGCIYGIFSLADLAVLTGIRLKPLSHQNIQIVLQRYGLQL
jgi:hypothetical protein